MIEHDDSVSKDDRNGIGDGIGEEKKGEHMKHEIYGTRSRSRFCDILFSVKVKVVRSIS